ncbi:DUF2169 domain-containing protein [Thalassococcus sp. S3]|uniref:DUF2169 family type VI secretion system accessory protein n=1 Tax=Thalassococcus sp. S3 TaxID=2017482 RepID=UPI001023F5B3|nr:DUF2169 domain-containing protein [Thalassococcus sp. S3]QBF32700.1 hypothetical protein CFI11_15975 [Thalassococcus sp. S3]
MAIELINRTPFANLRFSNLDATGQEFGVVMVKLAFDIPQEGGPCPLSSEQEPFVLTDEYHGELNFSSLRYASDFVPYKPATDVALDAIAYAPLGRAARWKVGARVADSAGLHVESWLEVCGPRQWEPRIAPRSRSVLGWEMTDPAETDAVELRYEQAFGGAEIRRDEAGELAEDYDERNPIGCGRVPRAWAEEDEISPVPAPQVLAAGEVYDSIGNTPAPAGFGPIPPAWLPRRPLGGTYDQNWLDNIWPAWAPDYDFAYHNSAHPKLQAEGFLKAPLQVELTGLHREKDVWSFEIDYPRLSLFGAYEDGRDEDFELLVDTVFIDIGQTAGTDPRVFVMLRAIFPMPGINRLEIYRPFASAELAPSRYHPTDVSCDPSLIDPPHQADEEKVS